MSTDLYQEIILEAARHPQHQGQLADADHVVSELNASCGDQVTLYLKMNAQTGQVTELKWQGTGCVISQAALSELAAKINHEQLTLAEIQALGKGDIETLLGIEEISPGRIKCLTLGLTAFSRLP